MTSRIRFRGRQADAVDRGSVERGVEAAHGDEASLALVIEHVDARQAANRFGYVLVGELADPVACQHAVDGVGLALAIDRVLHHGALADDNNPIVLLLSFRLVPCSRLGRSGLGGLSQGGLENRQRNRSACCAREVRSLQFPSHVNKIPLLPSVPKIAALEGLRDSQHTVLFRLDDS